MDERRRGLLQQAITILLDLFPSRKSDIEILQNKLDEKPTGTMVVRRKDDSKVSKQWPSEVYSLATIGNGVVVKSSQLMNAGDGLITSRSFTKGSVITAYSGYIVPVNDYSKQANPSHVLSLVSHRWLIDGRFDENGNRIPNARYRSGKGGGAYANDARDRGMTNAVYDTIDTSQYTPETAPTQRLVVLRAIRDISAGEEVFVSYGKDYWFKSLIQRFVETESTSDDRFTIFEINIHKDDAYQGEDSVSEYTDDEVGDRWVLVVARESRSTALLANASRHNYEVLFSFTQS